MATIKDVHIRNAEIKDKEYNLTIDDGLIIRIRPSRTGNGKGTKAWQFKYRHPVTKKITKISLGTYPSLKLAAAKLLAADFRRQLAEGTDPKRAMEEKKKDEQRKYSDTFEAIASEWFARKKKSISSSHADRVWRTLEKYVLKELGSFPVGEITRRDAVQLLRPLEKDGKLSTIKRICQSLNQVMEFAVAGDMLQANPLTKMINAFEKHKVEHMATIRPEMLEELLSRLEQNHKIQDKTKYLLLWQLHTISRPKEAARTRWKDIDLGNKCWTIPATEMKRRKEHKVPLTDEAIEILSQMRHYNEGKEFVFPGERNPDSHISVFTANAALKRSLDFKGELVAHGLRAIASTALHEKGFDTLLIEACLSHTDQNETRASYNHSDFYERRKEIMNWWSKFIILQTNKDTNL